MSDNVKFGATVLAAVIISFLVGGVTMELNGHDSSAIWSNLFVIIPVLVGLFSANNLTSAKVDEVKSTVNGTLDAKLAKLKEHTVQVIAAATRTSADDINNALANTDTATIDASTNASADATSTTETSDTGE